MCRQCKCTKEKIIQAAVEVFAEKGKHGARMEEIAKRAGVNKSMLYYYYSTKDNIFREMLRYIFGIIFSRLSESIDSINLETDSPVEKLKQLSRVYFSILSENINFVKTMAETLTKYPEEIQEVAREYKRSEAVPVPSKIVEVIQEGIDKKIFLCTKKVGDAQSVALLYRTKHNVCRKVLGRAGTRSFKRNGDFIMLTPPPNSVFRIWGRLGGAGFGIISITKLII